MKKTWIGIIFVLGSVLLIQTASAATKPMTGKEVTVIMNGNVVPDVQPIVQQGYTLVPLRKLQLLNVSLHWDAQTKTATVAHGANILTLPLQRKTGYKNKQPFTLPTPLKSINGRIMVPLRIVSELGFHVNYEPERVIAFINHPTYKYLYNHPISDISINRQHTISCPWVKPFPMLPASQQNVSNVYSYTFPKDEYDQYIYSNGKTATYVQVIEDVGAKVIWQGEIGAKGKIIKERGKRPDFKTVFKQNIVTTHLKNNKVRIEQPIETYYPPYVEGFYKQYEPKFKSFTSYKSMAQELAGEYGGRMPGGY